MKGNCPNCKTLVDETEYVVDLEKCIHCTTKEDVEQMDKIREKKLKRAIGYAASLVFFQEVGMGPDENLPQVNHTVESIQDLCFRETGIRMEGYPTEFLKEHQDLLMTEKLPYFMKKYLEAKVE